MYIRRRMALFAVPWCLPRNQFLIANHGCDEQLCRNIYELLVDILDCDFGFVCIFVDYCFHCTSASLQTTNETNRSFSEKNLSKIVKVRSGIGNPVRLQTGSSHHVQLNFLQPTKKRKRTCKNVTTYKLFMPHKQSTKQSFRPGHTLERQ